MSYLIGWVNMILFNTRRTLNCIIYYFIGVMFMLVMSGIDTLLSKEVSIPKICMTIRYWKVSIPELGIEIRHWKESIPGIGIEIGYRKVLIPGKGIEIGYRKVSIPNLFSIPRISLLKFVVTSLKFHFFKLHWTILIDFD